MIVAKGWYIHPELEKNISFMKNVRVRGEKKKRIASEGIKGMGEANRYYLRKRKEIDDQNEKEYTYV